MNKIKSFKDFLKEGSSPSPDIAEPTVRPGVRPRITPKRTPGRPSPIRRDRPSIVPKPKASAEDVAKKFLEMTENDKDINSILKKYKD